MNVLPPSYLFKTMSSKRSRSPTQSPAPATKGARRQKAVDNEIDTKKQKVSLFLFRRDLRVTDNTALIQLAKQSPTTPILPAFFFNPMQIDPKQNPYFGAHCVRFMFESLVDLNKQLDGKLILLSGSDECCIRVLQKYFDITTVAFNRDYTPFAQLRDAALEEFCAKTDIKVIAALWDYSLLPLNGVKSGADKPYAMFTPFYNKCMASHIPQILSPAGDDDVATVKRCLIDMHVKSNVLSSELADKVLDSIPRNTEAPVVGGREHALSRLHHVVPDLKHYETQRNFLSPQRTTLLSPYMKFGCVSVREVFRCASAAHGVTSCLVKELFWREFYAMLLFNKPAMCAGQLGTLSEKRLARGNMPFQEKYAPFRWHWDVESHWDAFKRGKTGVPLVDAAVRCLSATGWCHNRNRMVIGSFATKVLFVDWRRCEQWFATLAVDYDVSNNNGGWQWCSGQGADAMPFFRTFNPFQQAKKFDETCEFIKKWVPELVGVDHKVILAWDAKGTPALSQSTGYPLPIVDVKDTTKRVIAEYAKYT